MQNRSISALVAVALCGTPVGAGASDWRPQDTKRQVVYYAFHLADWGQTLDIADRCVPRDEPITFTEGNSPYENAAVENNPILGRCPDRSEVNAYFLTTAILHYGVARALPPKWRTG
ncbi:MAG: hypothetical protein ABEI13_01780, partial [Candidatus Paceibacteria bacterium]